MMINWEQLLNQACDAIQKAYCPYSNFPVGAAGLTDKGFIITGCNIENASYGLTMCAECSMVANLITSGCGGKLIATLCVNQYHELLSPCGRCRQVLFEHGGKKMLLMTKDGIRTLDDLLPVAFGPNDLL
jgi:cytidine deaminase